MKVSLATEAVNLIFVILAINNKSSCGLFYQFYYISKCLTNITTLRDVGIIILKKKISFIFKLVVKIMKMEYFINSNIKPLMLKVYLQYVPPALTYRNSVFCPQFIYVFYVDLRINSDYFSLQH